MTVKELIEELSKMPQEAEVYYHCGDNGWLEPEPRYDTWQWSIYTNDDTTWTGVGL